MLNRMRVLMLVPLVLMIGCTGEAEDPSNSSAIQTPDEIDPESSTPSTAPISFFPEAFAEDIDNLQLAIDLNLEQLITSCMAGEGFDYTALTIDEVKFRYGASGESYVVTNSAQLALDSVFREDVNLDVSPSNQENVAPLEEEDRELWQTAVQDCRVQESQRQESPWEAINTDWYQSLQADASARARSDARYLDAELESQACLTTAGFDRDIGSLLNEADEATGSIVTQYFSGEMTEDQARSMLVELASSQQQMGEAIELCDRPRLETERAIYVEYLNEIAEAEDIRIAEWLEMAEQAMSEFRTQLDELIDS